ncbi:MAG: hypothetical protein GC151_13680 [Betaproteobacteria bacterium]|nr:hypothetical protein [Betaproteobacteria bacterium]
MAVRVINPAQTVEYILEADRESEDPSVFVLRPMTWEQLAEFQATNPLDPERGAEISRVIGVAREEKRELTPEEAKRIDELAGGVKAMLSMNRHYAKAVSFGLVEVRGLLDQNRKPIQCAPEEFIRMSTTEILSELTGEILSMSRLSEDDRKN